MLPPAAYNITLLAGLLYLSYHPGHLNWIIRLDLHRALIIEDGLHYYVPLSTTQMAKHFCNGAIFTMSLISTNVRNTA